MINCKSFIDLMIEKWFIISYLLGALLNFESMNLTFLILRGVSKFNFHLSE